MHFKELKLYRIDKGNKQGKEKKKFKNSSMNDKCLIELEIREVHEVK